MEKLKPEDILSVEEIKPEDILSIEEPPKPKSISDTIGETALDVGRSVLSGLTFGGIEELVAGGKAGLESLGDSKESFQDLYRRYLEAEEKRTAEAQERSPIATTIGELAGGIAPAFVTGGASMAATGGSAVSRLAGKELLKAAGKAALAQGATGALGGAVAGGLTSKGKLIGATSEEQQELLKDVGSGALTGGVISGVIGAGVPLLKGALAAGKEALETGIEKTPLGQDLKTAMEMGKKDKGFATTASRKARLGEKEAAVNEVRRFLTNPEPGSISLEWAAGREFKEPLEALTEAGLKVTLPENTFKYVEFIEKQVDPDLAKQLYSMVVDGVSPYEAYEIRTKLKRLAKDNPIMAGSLKGLWKGIDNAIENTTTSDIGASILKELNLPTSYKSGLATYSDILRTTVESITEEGVPTDARRKFFHELAHEDATLDKKIRDLVDKYSLPGTTSETARRTIENAEGGIGPLWDELEKAKPEELKRIARRLGFEKAQEVKNALIGKIEKASREAAVARIIEGERPMDEALRLGDILSRKPLLKAVNIGSQASESLKRGARTLAEKTPVKVARQLYSLPETGLRQVASKLEQSPTMSKYAKRLVDALDAGDTVKKDAVLFLLMQNPDVRAIVPDLIGEEE